MHILNASEPARGLRAERDSRPDGPINDKGRHEVHGQVDHAVIGKIGENHRLP